MNAQDSMNQPKIAKETKNKIRVEFERTSLKERLKAKFLSLFFVKKVVWFIFRLVLLVGIAYVVLNPFLQKIAESFMSHDDFVDSTVQWVPRHFTLDTYKAILLENGYFKAFANTLILSLLTAIIQTLICCIIAYGLAKFKFKGNKAIFIAVIITMLIPHSTYNLSFAMNFTYFDLFGLIGKIGILPQVLTDGVNLMNTHWPLVILSLTGLAFKNGLYIFMLRQFFNGVPDELEESAYIDGSGVYRTFVQIILPLSVPMMITVFLFAFCWQWTDGTYTTLFYPSNRMELMPTILNMMPVSIQTEYSSSPVWGSYYDAIKGTSGLLIILPLVILYAFCQRFLVQGIERSGLTAD